MIFWGRLGRASTEKRISDLERNLQKDPEKNSFARIELIEAVVAHLSESGKYNEDYGRKAEEQLGYLIQSGRLDSRAFWNIFDKFAAGYKKVGRIDTIKGLYSQIELVMENYTNTREGRKIRFETMQFASGFKKKFL